MLKQILPSMSLALVMLIFLCGNTAPPKSTTDVGIEVKSFGAVGDGKADDTKALQSALDAARSAGGGIVLLPPGMYRTTADLVIGGKTSLRGAGRGSSIIERQPTSETVAVIKNFDRSATGGDADISISDVTLTRDGEAKAPNDPWDNTVQLYGVTRPIVRDCRIRGGAKGLHFFDCREFQAAGNVVDSYVDNGIAANAVHNMIGNGKVVENHFDSPVASGFVVGSSAMICTQSSTIIANNTFFDCGSNAIECGFSGVQPPSHLLIANNLMKSSGLAKSNNTILFTDRIDDALVTGNIIEKGSIYASCLDAAKSFNHRIDVTNNTITDGSVMIVNTKVGSCRGNRITRGGIAIKTSEDVVVADNCVSRSLGCGIHLLPVTGSTFANRRILVAHNVAFDNGTARTPGDRCGIIVDQGVTIELVGNRCYDTGGGDQLFGLYVNAVHNLRDVENNFANNASAARDKFTGVVTYDEKNK